MSTFRINITGAKELQGRLNNLSKELDSRISQDLRDGANNIAAEAKQRAATGAADQGILQEEIFVNEVDRLTFNVISGAIYSAYVEFGTRSQVSIPPGLEEYAAQFMGSAGASSLGAKEAIFAWCARKGIDQKGWYAIFVSIMVNGTKPHPFFFPAVFRQQPLIIEQVKRTLNAA